MPSFKSLTHSQDLDREDIPHPAAVPLPPAALPQLMAAHKADEAAKRVAQATRERLLREQCGFSPEGTEGDGY